MGTTVPTLYNTDFVEWAEHMAELVRARRFDELDLENLAEEIEDLARSQRSAVRAQLHHMLLHLVKEAMQPERSGKSWRHSITNAQDSIDRKITDSPGLRRLLEGELQNDLPEGS